MGWIRLVVRIGLLVCWTMVMFTFRLAALVTAPFSPALERRLRTWVFRSWARGAWRIAGIKVEVCGKPPEAPFYLVSNHLSYIDVIVFAGILGCVFVSKSEVARWPVIGPIVGLMNTIFIDRTRVRDTVRVNTLISDALDKGYGIHMFAEGGVSKDCTVNRFKPPLLEPAVQKGYPVNHAAISYRTENGAPPAREVVAWLEGVSFGGHLLRILRIPGFKALVAFGAEPVTGDDRKTLADELCEAVRAEFTPLN